MVINTDKTLYLANSLGIDHPYMTASQIAEAGQILNDDPGYVAWCIDCCIPPIWQAAHDYEYKQISGSAIGMLALGVYRGLPKSLAVQAWVSAIWTQYYDNKALLESGTPYAATMTDYSAHGIMPHTVPELRIEVEV